MENSSLKNANSIQRIANDINYGFAKNIIDTIREALVILDVDIRVVAANRSFYRMFDAVPKSTIGHRLYSLGNHQWDIPQLKDLLEEILPQNTVFNDYEVEHEFIHIGKRLMYLNARRIFRETEGMELILLAIEDGTERRKIEIELSRKNNELQEALLKVKSLHGILPLCSFCKKIRNDKGYWEDVDEYIYNHSEADVSHGVCPQCMKEHYSDW